MPVDHLGRLLVETARRHPHRVAVEDEAGRSWTYGELSHAADRVAAWLSSLGLGRGDLVGLFLPKSLEAVAAIHGALRAGAAYVPTDPTAPASRAATILADAGVRAIVVAAELVEPLRRAWADPIPHCPDSSISTSGAGAGPPPSVPPLLIVGEPAEPASADTTWQSVLDDSAPAPPLPDHDPDDLAYVLYTSGSTGRPKGVMLTHANAACFLNWCLDTLWSNPPPIPAGRDPKYRGRPRCLEPGPDDRFGSHAPFHFDLSVFDLFASCGVGGTLVLIGEALGKEPGRLANFLIERRLSVWYSAPSILALLSEYGALDRPGATAPSLVLFAGEVFPIRPLRHLRRLWPDAMLWNLYGPTETNVCTAYRIPDTIADDRAEPFPIGRVCPPLRARVVDEHGNDVPPGREGELVIAGPGVMRGYLGRPDLTARAFLADADGRRWYRTGDQVVDSGPEGFLFRGRRDRMVKRRGYRIELGEIECALARHEDVERAAVVAQADDSAVTVSAFLALRPGRKGSIIAFKRHCSAVLPPYMVPDTITFLPALPSTSTDKVDYPALQRMLEQPPRAAS